MRSAKGVGINSADGTTTTSTFSFTNYLPDGHCVITRHAVGSEQPGVASSRTCGREWSAPELDWFPTMACLHLTAGMCWGSSSNQECLRFGILAVHHSSSPSLTWSTKNRAR